MKKMSKAWKEGAAKFKTCKKLEGKTEYEKIDCTKEGLTITEYTDATCKTVAKLADGKPAVSKIAWGKCMTVGGKTYKATVDKKTVFGKYIAVGSATLLALFANQF